MNQTPRLARAIGNPFVIVTETGYELARFDKANPSGDIELLMNGAQSPGYGDWCGIRCKGNGSSGGYLDMIDSNNVRQGTVYAFANYMNVSMPVGSGQGFFFGVGNPGNWNVKVDGNLVNNGNNSKFGYSLGGTVVQTVSKSDVVALDNATGEITTHNANLAGGASVTFQFANNVIEDTDMILISHIGGGTLGAYNVSAVANGGGGACDVTIRNMTGGVLGEAIVLKFFLLKASVT